MVIFSIAVKVLSTMEPNQFLLDDIMQCPPILESIDIAYLAYKMDCKRKEIYCYTLFELLVVDRVMHTKV